MTETLEEAAENYRLSKRGFVTKYDCKEGFIAGAKLQQKRSYSEVEVLNLLKLVIKSTSLLELTLEEWFEEFKKK